MRAILLPERDDIAGQLWLKWQIEGAAVWPEDDERRADFLVAHLAQAIEAVEQEISRADSDEPRERLAYFLSLLYAHGGIGRLGRARSLEDMRDECGRRMLAATSAGVQLALVASQGPAGSLNRARGIMRKLRLDHIPHRDKAARNAWAAHRTVAHIGAAFFELGGQRRSLDGFDGVMRFLAAAHTYRGFALDRTGDQWPGDAELWRVPQPRAAIAYDVPSLTKIGEEYARQALDERAEDRRVNGWQDPLPPMFIHEKS